MSGRVRYGPLVDPLPTKKPRFNVLCAIKIKICIFFFLASRIRYEITRGNFGGAFAVKNMTGAIYVAGPLDYEQRKRVSTFFIISD